MLALELVGGAVVLLGVAFVLARQLPVFDDEADDSIDSGLPEDRSLQSIDIPRLRFRIGLRGYRMSDVDDALEAAELALAEWEQRAAAAEEVARPKRYDAPGGGPLARGRGRHVPSAPAHVSSDARPAPTEGPLSRGRTHPPAPESDTADEPEQEGESRDETA